jgi:hypothetical protein
VSEISESSPEHKRREPQGVKVMKVFEKNIGMSITAAELARETELTITQIQAVISNLRKNSEVLRKELIPLVSGNLWRYQPNRRIPEPANVEPVREPVATPRAPRRPSSGTTGAVPATPARQDRVVKRGSRLYEEVAKINDYVVIVDEDGKLYQARPLIESGD